MVYDNPEQFENLSIVSFVCPSQLSMYKSIRDQFSVDSQDREYIMQVMYENFMNSGNPLIPLNIQKIHDHIKREYGLKKHVIEHDENKQVVAISYSISDRYYVCIFLCVDQNRINEGNRRVANLLFGKYIEKNEGDKRDDNQVKDNSAKTKESQTMKQIKEKDTKKRKKPDIHSFFSSSFSDGSKPRKIYSVSNKLSRKPNSIDRASKISKKERERKILSLCTNGIIETVFYCCSCNRSFVKI